ncbi:hypothetical protein [Idiomarina aminovorans]|uniref:hypothetical protein n=1 Tax=Idiomarina aminovorans TaxID=2914829 RepID=UPI002003EA53|nr:hypothetical protein [Idiomarina sp. ATCH4]MCK7459823.1 hypothetical protein [Idiomarina sp. ATCH4]
MAKLIPNVVWCWLAGLLLFTLIAVSVSYFLTGYQAEQLNNTLRNQHKQLRQPAPQVPEHSGTILPELQRVDVASLLTQAAKRQHVDLYYQQNSERSDQWLVGITGSYQNAVRFIASILQTQKGSLQHFPFTQTLKWQDNDQNGGKLNWQFLWLTAETPMPSNLNGNPLFKTEFPPVLAEPLKCLRKPDTQSDINVSDWSVVQLLGTQTSPLKKALLQIPGQPVLTLTENSWLASPLMQLRKIEHNYVTFKHWQKEAGCWSAKNLTLSLTQDNNPQ